MIESSAALPCAAQWPARQGANGQHSTSAARAVPAAACCCSATSFVYNKTSGHHVVKSLLLLSERGHNKTNIEYEGRDDLAEKSPRRLSKSNPVSFQVGNCDSQCHLTERGLRPRRFHDGVVDLPEKG